MDSKPTALESESILVSVVINTFNRAKLLPRALNSALNQTYNNLEIIIIDADSVDNTKDVILEFTDNRIHYYHSETSRGVDCINLGFSKCTGKYVALLDDDDEWIPSKTSEQVALFESLDESYGWVGSGEVYIDDEVGQETRSTIPSLRGEILKDLLKGAGTGVSGGTTLMFRRSAIEKIGGFVDLDYSTDFLFYLRLSRFYKFDFVPKVLCRTHENHIYQKHRSSCLPDNTNSKMRKIEWNQYILNEYNDVFIMDPSLSYQYLRWLSRLYADLGDRRNAFRYLIKTVNSNPHLVTKNCKLIIRMLLSFPSKKRHEK